MAAGRCTCRRCVLWVADRVPDDPGARPPDPAPDLARRTEPTGQPGPPVAFMEVLVPRGGGPPPHVHPGTDEAYFLLAGDIEVLDPGGPFAVGTGDFVLVPRGVPHAYRVVGDADVRLLFLLSPVGVDGLLAMARTLCVPGHHAFT